MPQVLKDEVFERIFQAGVDVFYEKDYRSAKMKEIADKAGIPVSLIYNSMTHIVDVEKLEIIIKNSEKQTF